MNMKKDPIRIACKKLNVEGDVVNLNTLHLTQCGYSMALDTLFDLERSRKAQTLSTEVANFFKSCGFKAELAESGVNYTISY